MWTHDFARAVPTIWISLTMPMNQSSDESICTRTFCTFSSTSISAKYLWRNVSTSTSTHQVYLVLVLVLWNKYLVLALVLVLEKLPSISTCTWKMYLILVHILILVLILEKSINQIYFYARQIVTELHLSTKDYFI